MSIDATGDRPPVISTRGLTKRYGGVVAIDDLDVSFRQGAISGVIGPNGAGKSTLIGLLGGALRPTTGRIEFRGVDISDVSAAARARMGVGRTYQLPRPFLDMTVCENLQVPLFAKWPRLARREAIERTDRVLEQTGLAESARRAARELPLLRRKRLEVARALMLDPVLLLLDEVGAGLIDHEIDELIALIHSLGDGERSIVIIEHVIRIVRECCSELTVLNFGRRFTSGPTRDVLTDEKVAAVYLGTAGATQAGARARSEPRVRGDRPGTDRSSIPLLQLSHVSAGYGQARVLEDVSIEVAAGEVVAVLGSNGAGKTTLTSVITGSLAPKAGSVSFDGEDVTNLRGDVRFARGLACCLEGRRIFSELTVEENLLIALRGPARSRSASRLDAMYSLFPVLAERRRSPGTALSGGQLQMLAIGRALISEPRFVIFDEISLGLAPVVMDQLYETLARLRDEGLTMMVVEQDVERALMLADTAYVLRQGRIALSGPAGDLVRSSKLREVYIEHESSRTEKN